MYILIDSYQDGRPKYFKQMTAIGPAATSDISEAARFQTRDDAVASPAHRHWSANWKIEELIQVSNGG